MAQRNQRAFSKFGAMWRVLSLCGALALGVFLSPASVFAQSAPAGELEDLILNEKAQIMRAFEDGRRLGEVCSSEAYYTLKYERR